MTNKEVLEALSKEERQKVTAFLEMMTESVMVKDETRFESLVIGLFLEGKDFGLKQMLEVVKL